MKSVCVEKCLYLRQSVTKAVVSEMWCRVMYKASCARRLICCHDNPKSCTAFWVLFQANIFYAFLIIICYKFCYVCFITTNIDIYCDSLCYSLQCSVPVYLRHRITNGSSCSKEGGPSHVLDKTVTDGNSCSLQGVWSRHHTHWQQAPAVFPQALPCGHNFLLWTGPRRSSLESEEWWNRNANQFKVSITWPCNMVSQLVRHDRPLRLQSIS